MAGWQWTVGLGCAAVIGAALAPQLQTAGATVAAPPVNVPQGDGALTVQVASDRQAVVRGSDEVRFVTVTLTPQVTATSQVRRPVHLSVVLDTSGSMSSEGKMVQARRAARSLAHALGPNDTFSLVTFNNQARTIVAPTPDTSLAGIDGILDRLSEGGGTNLHGGLSLGMSQFTYSARTDAVDRVIVLSDGQANAGIVSPDAIAHLAATAQAQGIGVTTVGLGLDYNEDLLARMADAGGGTYAFVDQASDLQQVFADELSRTANVVAQHTAVDLVFPPGVEPLELVGWEGGRIDGGWRVPVGDMYTGDPRKIVARVRVRAQDADSLTLATATASWIPSGSEQRDAATAHAVVQVTHDARVAEASADANATRASNRAWSHNFLDLSARAYAEGDQEKAEAILVQGTEALEELEAMGLDDEAVREDIANFKSQAATYQNAAPSSTEGKRAIKAGKEMARVGAKH